MERIKRSRIISYGHAIITVVLAAIFINASIKKFTPKPLKPIDQAELVHQIIEQESYAPPIGYKITMNTMKQSGFLKLIGVFQLLAALFMLIPRLRLTGLLILFPIIFNIFFMHVFFDNRMHENMETGILLGITILLLGYYYKRIAVFLWSKKESV